MKWTACTQTTEWNERCAHDFDYKVQHNIQTEQKREDTQKITSNKFLININRNENKTKQNKIINKHLWANQSNAKRVIEICFNLMEKLEGEFESIQRETSNEFKHCHLTSSRCAVNERIFLHHLQYFD